MNCIIESNPIHVHFYRSIRSFALSTENSNYCHPVWFNLCIPKVVLLPSRKLRYWMIYFFLYWQGNLWWVRICGYILWKNCYGLWTNESQKFAIKIKWFLQKECVREKNQKFLVKLTRMLFCVSGAMDARKQPRPRSSTLHLWEVSLFPYVINFGGTHC